MAYQRAIGKTNTHFPRRTAPWRSTSTAAGPAPPCWASTLWRCVFPPWWIHYSGESTGRKLRKHDEFWYLMMNYDGELWWTSIMIMMNYGELLYSALVRHSLKLSSCASLRGSDKSTRLDRMHHHFSPSPAIKRAIINWSFLSQLFLWFLIREVWLAAMQSWRWPGSWYVMIIPFDREIPDISKPLTDLQVGPHLVAAHQPIWEMLGWQIQWV